MKLVSTALLFLVSCCPAIAQENVESLKVAAPISDHMVLQHGTPVSIWGTAKPDALVTVSFDFAKQSVETTADEKGNWNASIGPFKTSAKPKTITVVSGNETLAVRDVLVGEVWMCSGQSNMAWTLMKSRDPIFKEADFPMIRVFRTQTKTSVSPQSDCAGQWIVSESAEADRFSAVAFHFGKKLFEELNVPIGLVDTSWGGKPVEAFTSEEKLRTVDAAIPLLDEWGFSVDNYNPEAARKRFDTAMKKWKLKRDEVKEKNKTAEKKQRVPRRPQLQGPPKLDPRYPGAIYNQMVAPWTRFPVAGAIWYQGEANAARSVQYESLLTALIEDWRVKWGSDFPFYIVQLANFKQPTTEPGVPNGWAELQYFQTKVAQTVPNCGVAIINDIGDAKNIHPSNKRDVGQRLALLALRNHYGKKIEAFSGPLFKSHRVEDDHIMITMEHVGRGLKTRDGKKLKRFEIAGKKQNWHWADAEIVATNMIRVSSSNVPQPVAVRYAWASNPEGANLVNSGDLPASIFRTDDWPLSTESRATRNPNIRKTAKHENAMRLEEQGFQALFNGKDLSGWRNPYEFGTASITNSELRLTAEKKFFLVTEKTFSNFVLYAEIRLPEGKANSGIMFRCHVEPNRVYGYQAECDGSDRRWSAGLYDEGRRGWIWPSKTGRTKVEKFLEYEKESQAHFAKPMIRDALKRNKWNRYKIICNENKITIELNGVRVTEIEDDTDAEGYIGIQHHGEKGQTYRFRNIYIKELK